MSRKAWHVSILIPARNEEELLPRCLESVLSASAALPEYAATDIIVVADSSTDDTASIASNLLGDRGIVIHTKAGCVGEARRLGAEIALRRCRAPYSRCWLANTDADSVVPVSWLREQLRLADKGVEAIAGTVAIDGLFEKGSPADLRYRAHYVVEPDGPHGHVHGANLGIRADVYLRAGGWEPLITAEDHRLWKHLQNIGATTVATDRIEIITSNRRFGRAPQGFAELLAAHDQTAA